MSMRRSHEVTDITGTHRCGGSGGRSRCPRRPVPGGAAVAGVPHQLVDDLAAGRRAEATSRRCAAGGSGGELPDGGLSSRSGARPSCCASARVRVWSAPRPWLSGRGRPGAWSSDCWRCAAFWRASAASTRWRSRSRSRAGVGLVHGVALTRMGTAVQKPRWLSAPIGWGSSAGTAITRNQTEPTGAELSGDMSRWVSRTACGQVELI
jgi:hypothetical protein